MIAHTPSLVAILLRVSHLIRLAIDAWLHNMVSADGAVINVDVPGPECYSIPLSHFKSLLCRGFDHFSLKLNLVNIDYNFSN